MSWISDELKRRAEAVEDLAVTAAALNQHMKYLAGSQPLYTTLFHSVIDFTDRNVTYVNCGHPAPLLFSKGDREVGRLMSQNMPIGLFGPDEFGIPIESTV